ncbi:MAG: YlbF family regulator [Chloroflexota bacterium]
MYDTLTDTQTLTVQDAVRGAARDFAAALAATPQFVAFERAAEALEKDDQANRIINEYQQLQHSLYMMTMLGAVSPEDQADLDALNEALQTNGTIMAYSQSQAELALLCQEAGSLLSQRIGINFAAACGKSCCG